MSQLLKELYEEMYGPLDAPGKKKMKNLAKMAATLSRIANRRRPWTNRYLNSLIKGNEGFTITQELERALFALASRLDEQSPLQALVKPIQVLTTNGHVQPNSIILGSTKFCLGCQTAIVPIVPWQDYCDPECRRKARNQRRRSLRRTQRAESARGL